MYECPIHGLTSLSMSCEHIADAIDADHVRPVHVAIDSRNDPTIVCDQCWNEVVHRTANMERWIMDDLEAWVPVVPLCFQHLKEWYVKIGQGEVLAAIAQARADRST
jgi:hypothetical protein